MITIVENLDIHDHIMLLVILDINSLQLKLYEVDKLTYFLLYIWIVLLVIFVSHGLNSACKTYMFCKKCFSQHKLFLWILNVLLAFNFFLLYWKYMNIWIEYIRLYKLNIWIENILNCWKSKGGISMWGRSSVTDIWTRIRIRPFLHTVLSHCWVKYGWFQAR
jgi:hypothetical protein